MGITGITTYKELAKLFNENYEGVEMTEQELEELMDKYIPRKVMSDENIHSTI